MQNAQSKFHYQRRLCLERVDIHRIGPIGRFGGYSAALILESELERTFSFTMPVNGSLPICLAQKLFSPPHQYRAAFFSTSRPILPSFRHSRKPFSRARAIPLPLRTQQRKTLTPFGILFLFGATYAFYSHTMKQPLLCEAPPPLERSCLNYADTFDFPDMESINKTFASHEISYRGAPRCGYVRYDCTSLPANQPGEDIASDTMVGDPNENMVSGPWMVTMWGLYDGHV